MMSDDAERIHAFPETGCDGAAAARIGAAGVGSARCDRR
jgi:hypothetical protein